LDIKQQNLILILRVLPQTSVGEIPVFLWKTTTLFFVRKFLGRYSDTLKCVLTSWYVTVFLSIDIARINDSATFIKTSRYKHRNKN